MKAPLKERHVNAVNAHQWLCTQKVDPDLVPYLCPDGHMLVAREEGLYCQACGYTTDTVTYPGKMNVTGKIRKPEE
jgi:hypothetical protein